MHEVTRNARIKPQAVTASELETAYPAATDAVDAWNNPDASP